MLAYQPARRATASWRVRPLYLRGGARNATLRFDLDDVRKWSEIRSFPVMV